MNTRTTKSINILLCLVTGLGSQIAYSGGMRDSFPSNMGYVGSLSVGAAWEAAGKSQTFYLTPEIEKAYIADKSTHAMADAALFLGLQRNLNSVFQGQLGIVGGVTSDARISGEIWDDAQPQFNNYTYTYKVQHSYVGLKGALLADLGFVVKPWISAAVAVGFNRSHDFNNTPTIFEAVANSNFASNTQTSFTYTAGAGFQYTVSKKCQVGIGYQFSDWGSSNLGRASGQTLNGGLYLNHLYTHGALINLTYIS